MTRLLQRFYWFTQKHPWLYPIYLTVRLPVIFPVLAGNEGVLGALRWIRIRFGYLLANLRLYGKKEFFNQPMESFHSRKGFILARLVEYIIYDEVFVDRCYAFKNFESMVQKASLVVDFGTHHGMFINFVRSINPTLEVHGGEMNPDTFAAARKRFEGTADVSISNFAIGGLPRMATIGLTTVSIEQSLYSNAEGRETREVEVITPAEFVKRSNLTGRTIDLMKMDIEGAEREVFEHMDSIRSVLEQTRLLVMEIHTEEDARVITGKMAHAGFCLLEQIGNNFLFERRA